MELIHLTCNDYKTSEWSGGTTMQIAIMPRDAQYSDRNFLWRISSATVDLEESDFTSLPDYHRYISTLKGNLVLSHNNGEKIRLKPYHVHSFDGGDNTHSIGSCTDFNLMLRKEQTAGKLESLILNKGKPVDYKIVPERERLNILIYCATGIISLSVNGNSHSLPAKESILISTTSSVQFRIHADENSECFLATIHY